LPLLSKRVETVGTNRLLLLMQSDSSPAKSERVGGGGAARRAKGKAQDHAAESSPKSTTTVAETLPLDSTTESKDHTPPVDLRRTKTAGEALLRPSATDGLIARVSKISTPSLIDKKGTPRAALQRTQNASAADAASTKSQDDLQRILKDCKPDADDEHSRGEAVPLSNVQRQDITLSLTAMQRKLLQRGIGIELVGMPPPAIDLTIRAWSAKNAPRHILQQVPAFLPP
jgi:hypothetical protein